MTRSEPPRWLEGEEAPEPLRRLLMASRAELGTPAQVDALAQQLARVLGPGAALGAPEHPDTLPPTRMPPRGVALGWLVPLGAATGILALWWLSNTSRAPLPSNTPLPAPAPALSTAPASAASAVPVAAARGVPPAAPLPAMPLVDPGEDGAAPHGPVSDGTAQRARATAARSVAPHARSAASANEAALLEKARALLSREPARALALTREHRRRFPHGALAEEREVIAIEALKQLGQERAASDEADAFGTQYKNSVHRQRLQQPSSR